jgi:3-hydroxyisobutyrate dehydrogenase-like beta-hydroxyacid dehydrogenase
MRDIRGWHGDGVRSVAVVTAIAVLGTGHMGAAIARRLLAAGHHVALWNRTPSRTAGIGARPAASPARAVRGASVAVVMVTDAAAVDAVLFGPEGAAAALRPGACVVQMSTIGPGEVHDVARRLPDGVGLVDAPVAGSVAAAGAGRLTILAGGTPAALARAEPVLTTLGTVRPCGDVGAGAAVKLILNTALMTAMTSLADAVSVAEAVGVDRAAALDVLASSALGGAVARATATGAAFSVALARKDLDLALRELSDLPAPVARAASRALSAVPDQSADISELIRETR